MAKYQSFLYYRVSMTLILYASLPWHAISENRKNYIVYMGAIPKGRYSTITHHQSLLEEVIEERSVENYHIRSYQRSFNGFAAKLTDQEAQKLANMEGIVSVFPSKTLQLQTTRSWDFMGFDDSLQKTSFNGSNVIIGVIDSGIWPESESFNDKGFGPPPQKWKGACEGGHNFTCNKKLIGARHYPSNSSRDYDGHGTHTASIAAGNKVTDVSYYGIAKGTARGGLPSARISAYSVCDQGSCEHHDILAAFDDAIADGVDILSVSLGGNRPVPFDDEPTAIGAFHAIEKGILTVQAGGNLDAADYVVSVAPWIFTVAASSTDRRIVDKVLLANGKAVIGASINGIPSNGTKVPLNFGCEREQPRPGCLNATSAKDRILLCDTMLGVLDAHKAGAFGVITQSDIDMDVSDVIPFPGAVVETRDYNFIAAYVDSTDNPRGEILKSEALEDANAPTVALFSCRGPNKIVPEIMKPDITAPGIEILAAYSPSARPSEFPEDKRHIKYNVLSGTSMACPHVAGVAAYVKAVHPDWSHSTIKSAIMTTAWEMNATTNPDREFSYGSGHINPLMAINPGLVYEVGKGDYINMLCSMGYTTKKIRLISGDNTSCPKVSNKMSAKDLNYPSMTAFAPANKPFTVGFRRTLTNVGSENSTYRAKVSVEPKTEVKVTPKVLSFKSINEKKSFVVTITGELFLEKSIVSASLVWSDGIHNVRSPIVVYNKAKY